MSLSLEYGTYISHWHSPHFSDWNLVVCESYGVNAARERQRRPGQSFIEWTHPPNDTEIHDVQRNRIKFNWSIKSKHRLFAVFAVLIFLGRHIYKFSVWNSFYSFIFRFFEFYHMNWTRSSEYGILYGHFPRSMSSQRLSFTLKSILIVSRLESEFSWCHSKSIALSWAQIRFEMKH